MATMITVTDKSTSKKVHLTDGMITDMKRNDDDTATIELGKENVVFDSIEPYDWIFIKLWKIKIKMTMHITAPSPKPGLGARPTGKYIFEWQNHATTFGVNLSA